MNRFLQEITLQVCSSLDIEKGMARAFSIIRTMMPAEDLMLHFYDPKADAIRLIARADKAGGQLENRIIPLGNSLDLAAAIQALPRTAMVNTPGTNRLTDAIMAAYGMTRYSLVQMFLETREQKYGLGHLTLCARGTGRYTPADLRHFISIREPFTIATINALHHLKILAAREDLAAENRLLKKALSPAPALMIGEETGLRQVMTQIRQVAPQATPVLITGETGVGKEMAANRIHSLSPRNHGPFIKLNCGAVPDTLVDSEFFGHEKGAFSGAVAAVPGIFERAHQGTLFLDEIGELSPTAQVRLLRVLQNGIIERVGGTRPIQTRVRIIAATNRDLEEMVRAKAFRSDLWFRLNVFPIEIPPLRRRAMDIPLLAHHFIREKAREMNLSVIPDLTAPTLAGLTAYAWPGNIRELRNILERSLILNRGEALAVPALIPVAPPRATVDHPADRPDASPADLNLDRAMAAHIEKVLAVTDGKIHGPGGAAELLGLNAGTLRHRMDRLGIVYGRKRNQLTTTASGRNRPKGLPQ